MMRNYRWNFHKISRQNNFLFAGVVKTGECAEGYFRLGFHIHTTCEGHSTQPKPSPELQVTRQYLQP
jgi:hypothetical protein